MDTARLLRLHGVVRNGDCDGQDCTDEVTRNRDRRQVPEAIIKDVAAEDARSSVKPSPTLG